MQRAVLILGLMVAAALFVGWATGGYAALQTQVLQGQRAVQSALADAVRAIRAGQAEAVWGLLAVCFSYGVVHAAGPGHGKVLIGGYGIARRVPVLALSGIALASSLAQAAVAVIVVFAGVAVLGWTRLQMEGVAESIMAPVGSAAIAAVGLWLVWRGLRGIRAAQTAHGEGHAHDSDCGCGHAHGPSLDAVDKLVGWRDTAALMAGIALRPCSGALFLLVLTWQLGIGLAGIAGTVAMGLGTAVVTIGVALMAVWAREGALASLPVNRITRALPWLELLAGAVVALVALSLLAQAL